MVQHLDPIFPPKPEFTLKDVPDLTGKVYIVTGSNTGVGKEPTQMLYSKNATVYMLSRSESKTDQSIKEIKSAAPYSTGRLVFIHLDLSDESKLHVLFNNAGVQTLGQDSLLPSTTAQGHEMHLGVIVLGTFLLTKLLTPILVATAASETPGTVRVVWVSSSGTEFVGEQSRGLPFDRRDEYASRPALERYGISKAGNWLHGVEFARLYKANGVISIPLNPGNLGSDSYREHGTLFRVILRAILLYPSINGAYTELFAGLSPAVTIEKAGQWVALFGRFLPIREDLLDATKSEDEGGNGHATRFWDWTENEVRPYL